MPLNLLSFLFIMLASATISANAGVIGKDVTGTWQDHVACAVWANGLSYGETLKEKKDEHTLRAKESGGYPVERDEYFSVYYRALGKMEAVDKIYPRTRLYFDMGCQQVL